MDWSDNIPVGKDRTTKSGLGFPSFLSMVGWAGMAFIIWFFWTLFSPPIMQQMFGPVFIAMFLGFVAFMLAGIVLRTIWGFITWIFGRR